MDITIDDFITYLGSERGLSKNTLLAYRRDLERLFEFTKTTSRPWPPELDDVMEFIKVEQQAGKKTATLVRAIIAIKVFLRFLFREGTLAQNIGPLLQTPKLWQTIPSVLSHHEIDCFLQSPDLTTPKGLRDKAILELLYGTGIRVSELCGLLIYDVSDDVIKVRGKGSKERIVPIGKEALKAIDAYLVGVRGSFESERSQFLFLTEKGKPITRLLVWQLVRHYAAVAGLTKKISPHTFRHTYASHLLDAGADLRIIQDLLGHAHISSTDRYTHVSTSQLREVFRTFHPRWKGSDISEKQEE
jgi:integrase/recombinase XerD